MTPTNTMIINAPPELTAENCGAFRDKARTEIGGTTAFASIDLSATRFIDSSGLGTLVSIHKQLRERGGELRLLNPSPAVRQIIELTRMHRVFEIVNQGPPQPAG